MLGVVPVVVWTRPNETGDGYLARVEARTLDGRVVGAAESECSRVERKWKNADPFAIRSMASTRATVRALRGPLGQIAVLAGYEATPAEEMSVSDLPTAADKAPAPSAPTSTQRERISELIVELRDVDKEREHEPRDWGAWCRDYAGVESFDELDEMSAARLIHGLEHMLGQRGDPEMAA